MNDTQEGPLTTLHTYAQISVHTCTHTKKIIILKILIALMPIIKLLKAEMKQHKHIYSGECDNLN